MVKCLFQQGTKVKPPPTKKTKSPHIVLRGYSGCFRSGMKFHGGDLGTQVPWEFPVATLRLEGTSFPLRMAGQMKCLLFSCSQPALLTLAETSSVSDNASARWTAAEEGWMQEWEVPWADDHLCGNGDPAPSRVLLLLVQRATWLLDPPANLPLCLQHPAGLQQGSISVEASTHGDLLLYKAPWKEGEVEGTWCG